MLDVKPQLVTALNKILPTYYELFVDSKTPLPCITYLEAGNSDNLTGDTLGYSDITFNVKIWGHSIDNLMDYALSVDSALRELGYSRVASNELTQEDQVCKILTYQGLGLENY